MRRTPVHTRGYETNCRRCRQPAGNFIMVQCEYCNTRYHANCVGKDPADPNQAWTCGQCHRHNTPDSLEEQGAYGGSTRAVTVPTPSRLLNRTVTIDDSPLRDLDKQALRQSTPVSQIVCTDNIFPSPFNAATDMSGCTAPSTNQMANAQSYAGNQANVLSTATTQYQWPPQSIQSTFSYTPTTDLFHSTSLGLPCSSNNDVHEPNAQTSYGLSLPQPMISTQPPIMTPRVVDSQYNYAQQPNLVPMLSTNTHSNFAPHLSQSVVSQYGSQLVTQQQQGFVPTFQPQTSAYVQPMSHPVAQSIVQQMPQHMPQSMSQSMMQPLVQQISQYMPQQMPFQAVPPMAQQMPLQFPQQIPQQQQIPADFGIQFQQLMARQIIKQDLPAFSGHPEEWPLFISSFQQTTRTAGFTNDENIHRLRKALKGDALHTVQGLLCDAVHVDRIMATLQQRFGQPESIIRNQIERIRQESSVKADKLDTIVNFSILVANLCATMEAAMHLGHVNNPLLLQELVEKLPPQLKLQWATMRMMLPQVNIRSFSNWLENMATAISIVQPYTPPVKGKGDVKSSGKLNVHLDTTNETTAPAPSSESTANCQGILPVVPKTSKPDSTKTATPKATTKAEVCHACKEKGCKVLSKCTTFKDYSENGRWNLVKRAKLCRVCFGSHHTKDCSNSRACGTDGCEKLHHPLLHTKRNLIKEKDTPKDDNPIPSTSRETTSTTVATVSRALHHQMLREVVMYRVIPVILYGPTTEVHDFAFLDDGASVTLIEQELADQLNVHGEKEALSLKWTADVIRFEENSELVSLRISGDFDRAESHELEARTVDSLNLPMQSVNIDELGQTYPHLKRLPIKSYGMVKPRILIGLDNVRLSIPLKTVEGVRKDDPPATRTRLGWCFCGKTRTQNVYVNHVNLHICSCAKEQEKLETLIRQYHSIDALGIVRNPDHEMSKEHKRAQKIMEASLTTRDGRYEVSLLWRAEQVKLPDSRKMAESRLKTLERRLLSSPALLQNVREQLATYKEKGYIRKVSQQELENPNPRRWYLPIFPVLNPNKPSKVRLVWDAAAEVDGMSLNSALLQGPDLYSSLFAILLRFRQHKVAITADIEQMFHRVFIRPVDQQSQLFLWRDCNQKREPDVYAMQVMLFGSKSSPYQSQYVMKHNASRFQDVHPRAVQSIQQNHYVDDLLDSFETNEEAINVAQQIRQIHEIGGFNIRNWLSNSPAVQRELNKSDKVPGTYQITTPNEDTEKVLGIFWNTATDEITYSLKYNKANSEVLNANKLPTKRESLRTLMSCYDPLGYLGHLMIGLKLIQQELWRYNISWDDNIPPELQHQWKSWLKHLPGIEHLAIPRSYIQSAHMWKNCAVDIITFVDASDKAYACASYFRIVTPDGQVQTALVASKTKTAPLKHVSIPRLELQSAVIGTRLTKTILESISMPIRSVKYFTDSTTVLYWLDLRRRLQSYMACRVGEILESSTRNQWYWVPTKDNVADKGTKWNPNFVLDDDEWFKGPKFLLDDPADWPVESRKEVTAEVEENLSVHIIQEVPIAVRVMDPERFSQWRRMRRAMAYAFRFIRNCLTPPAERTFEPLTMHEMFTAEVYLFREAQREQYADDLKSLSDKKPISRKSLLKHLSPKLDRNRLIRHNSRIVLSSVMYDTKYPIILPRQERIAYLIIHHIHAHECAHQFSETVVNNARQRFHISGLRTLVKKVVRECNECRRRKARPVVPEMSPLPLARVADHCAPFTYTGVDLYGPMNVSIGRRSEKRWGVLFTCLTIRAIHIEVAKDLSTEAFIICFRNFTNRRGTPREIYCDKGTNFVGAQRVLQDLQNLNFKEVEDRTTTSTMKWVFNPPSSPHMGGAWERLIRSVKSALDVLQTERSPTPETLYSLMVEVEFMINSRPLTYIPIFGPEEPALTPNDFFFGTSDGSKVLGNPSDTAYAVRYSWEFTQNTTQKMYKRWLTEYLPTITRRSKWFDHVPNLQEGDCVIIVDKDNKRRDWKRGRILKVNFSKDGNVRSATVQTSSGIYVRPASKLAKLDLMGKESEQGAVHALGC